MNRRSPSRDRVPRERDWLKGGSYLDAVGVLVPRAVWPGRPRPLGERYVAEFYTDYWRRGGGFGFTPVGEAYWNWGWKCGITDVDAICKIAELCNKNGVCVNSASELAAWMMEPIYSSTNSEVKGTGMFSSLDRSCGFLAGPLIIH